MGLDYLIDALHHQGADYMSVHTIPKETFGQPSRPPRAKRKVVEGEQLECKACHAVFCPNGDEEMPNSRVFATHLGADERCRSFYGVCDTVAGEPVVCVTVWLDRSKDHKSIWTRSGVTPDGRWVHEVLRVKRRGQK